MQRGAGNPARTAAVTRVMTGLAVPAATDMPCTLANPTSSATARNPAAGTPEAVARAS
jgi:hypothetical protein